MRQVRDDTTARIEGIKPAALRDDDAPTGGSHETPSSLWRRGIGFGLDAAKAGKSVSWAIVALVAVLSAAAVAWRYVDAEAECSPLVVQYVLHQAATGEIEAAKLEAAGQAATAAAVRSLTNIEHQPDDVQLCVLLDSKRAAQ